MCRYIFNRCKFWLTANHKHWIAFGVDSFKVDGLTHHNVSVDADVAQRHDTGHKGQHVGETKEATHPVPPGPAPQEQADGGDGHIDDRHKQVGGGQSQDEHVGDGPQLAVPADDDPEGGVAQDSRQRDEGQETGHQGVLQAGL